MLGNTKMYWGLLFACFQHLPIAVQSSIQKTSFLCVVEYDVGLETAAFSILVAVTTHIELWTSMS